MNQTTDLSYPRFLASHPRNAGVDFSALDLYARGQVKSDGSEFSMFIRAKQRMDAVWIPGVAGPLVSEELRAVFEQVVSRDVQFLPVQMNKKDFWIVRVSTELDVLDPDQSNFRRSPEGEISSVEHPVWLGYQIDHPRMFTVPQQPRTIWATPEVAAAYAASGCTGLHFFSRGTVV